MLIIGHRGARALAPENTLPALEIGMRCADYVEVDVRLSHDGVPVVIHDATLDRTTDGTGPVGNFTLSQLRLLGAEIPTLQEVLDFVGSSGLVVEIKETGSEEGICALLRMHEPENLLVVSFGQESLRLTRQFLPEVRTGLIYSGGPADPVELALSIHVDLILPEKHLLKRELVAVAHRKGLLVIAWTVNTPEEIRDVLISGADGFASDDPCSARRLLSGDHKLYIETR